MMIKLDKLKLRRRHFFKAACLMRVVSLVLVGLISSCAGPERWSSQAFEAPAAVNADIESMPHAMATEDTSRPDEEPLTNAIFEVPEHVQNNQIILNSYQQNAASQSYQTPVDVYAIEPRGRAASYPVSPSSFSKMRCQHGYMSGGSCPQCERCPNPAQSPACYPGSPCYGGCQQCQSAGSIYKDEYLCDGGNREPSLYRPPLHPAGLETEDTLVQYSTVDGKNRTRYSNPVCVYAPRFSEVRSTSNIRQNINIDKVAGAHELAYGTNLKARVEPGLQQLDAKPSEADVRNRASGYEGRVQEGSVAQPIAVDHHMELTVSQQELAFVNPGATHSDTRALYMNSLQAAVTWTRDLYPQISATAQGGNEINSMFKAAGIDGVELNGRPGELIIIKQADLTEAHEGEVITFTIQFRNTGTEPVNRVVISDNLTPRLGYVEGSQTIDLQAEFRADDNGEGSSVLSWGLLEPLEGGAQGKITFKTVVR